MHDVHQLKGFYAGCLALAAGFCAPALAASGEGAAILDTNQCRPVYPHEAMRRGEQGVVKLQFTVGANGKLVGSAVIKSSGFRELDQAALTALIRCRFKPAYRNNVAAQEAFVMEYRWELPPRLQQ
jgi:protein TonB